MAFTLVMLPPQNDTTRSWAKRIAADAPDTRVVVAEDVAQATREIAEAEAAYGTLPPTVLAAARRLRWLQAPQAGRPAGWYYPELIAHPVVVTNFREIYNDHIAAHIMAFVLAFARGAPLPAPPARARMEARGARYGRRPSARGHRAHRR